jgi:hypothetical protein
VDLKFNAEVCQKIDVLNAQTKQIICTSNNGECSFVVPHQDTFLEIQASGHAPQFLKLNENERFDIKLDMKLKNK